MTSSWLFFFIWHKEVIPIDLFELRKTHFISINNSYFDISIEAMTRGKLNLDTCETWIFVQISRRIDLGENSASSCQVNHVPLISNRHLCWCMNVISLSKRKRGSSFKHFFPYRIPWHPRHEPILVRQSRKNSKFLLSPKLTEQSLSSPSAMTIDSRFSG